MAIGLASRHGGLVRANPNPNPNPSPTPNPSPNPIQARKLLAEREAAEAAAAAAAAAGDDAAASRAALERLARAAAQTEEGFQERQAMGETGRLKVRSIAVAHTYSIYVRVCMCNSACMCICKPPCPDQFFAALLCPIHSHPPLLPPYPLPLPPPSPCTPASPSPPRARAHPLTLGAIAAAVRVEGSPGSLRAQDSGRGAAG